MHREDCQDKFIKKLEERKDLKNFCRQVYRQWQRQLVPDNKHLETGNNQQFHCELLRMREKQRKPKKQGAWRLTKQQAQRTFKDTNMQLKEMSGDNKGAWQDNTKSRVTANYLKQAQLRWHQHSSDSSSSCWSWTSDYQEQIFRGLSTIEPFFD